MDYNNMLKQKRAFITTGARGIGREIALLFARQGAAVVVGGKNLPKLAETMEEIRSVSPQSKGYACNLSDEKEITAVCDQILEDFAGIDILVNTVGINRHGEITEYSMEMIDTMFNTNYKSGLICAQKFLPGMVERGYGNIINISSIHGSMTMPGFGIYAGTKGAVNATARAMALDYAKKGIRVNNISPGLILSDNMQDEILDYPEGEQRERFMEMLRNMQPLPPGKMEDIANAALFLASDMSAYITGQTIFADGGASIKAH